MGILLAVETKPLHGIKRVPQCNHIGEKPLVILYTYINLHTGTPKPQSFLSVWEFRTTVIVVVVVVVVVIVIWSFMVLEKLNNFTNISI